MSVKPHLVPSRGQASPNKPHMRTSVVRTIITACSGLLITLIVVYRPFFPYSTSGESPAAQANVHATVIAIGPPLGFSVTTLHPGDVVKQSVKITIRGTYSSVGSGQVWVILEDNFRNYYLQTPPVRFNGDGTWTATNINPGPGIIMVDFVSVSTAGNAFFWQKVKDEEYGAFSPLPDGSQVLQAIPIQVSP